jgi:allantoinase
MLIIRGARVALPDGVQPASIRVDEGRILSVGAIDHIPFGARVMDAGDLVVLPGLVDIHVHVNDPGRAEWEGFEYATRAAAAGGVTTIVDMPLNSLPPTIDVRAFEVKKRAANRRTFVDVGFWGGVVPGSSGHLDALYRAGVRGFKCFLAPSGVDEFPAVTEADLREVAPVLGRLDAPLLVHAELPAFLRDPRSTASSDVGRDPSPDPTRYATWLASRPPEAEDAAIDLLIQLAREYALRVHVVHLASARALPRLEAARRELLMVSVETCPHYLQFAAEEIPDAATSFKCAPPIRERANREGLWEGLRRGTIDLVASDHSPSPPALKHLEEGDFVRAWGGIASLQVGLAATWSGAVERGFGIEHLVRWMADAPARVAGLSGRKGAIVPGHDADLVFWDAEATLDVRALYHRHPITPYAGMRLRGVVVKTLLRGEVIFEDGASLPEPHGELLIQGRG